MLIETCPSICSSESAFLNKLAELVYFVPFVGVMVGATVGVMPTVGVIPMVGDGVIPTVGVGCCVGATVGETFTVGVIGTGV